MCNMHTLPFHNPPAYIVYKPSFVHSSSLDKLWVVYFFYYKCSDIIICHLLSVLFIILSELVKVSCHIYVQVECDIGCVVPMLDISNPAVSSYQYRSINPLFTLDIFICSFHKCIQYTTRGQSKFPLSKLWCCYIFIVLKCWW